MAKNVKYWLFKGFLMKKEEKTVKSDLVFDGKVLHVYNDQISLADGRLSTRASTNLLIIVYPIVDIGLYPLFHPLNRSIKWMD